MLNKFSDYCVQDSMLEGKKIQNWKKTLCLKAFNKKS